MKEHMEKISVRKTIKLSTLWLQRVSLSGLMTEASRNWTSYISQGELPEGTEKCRKHLGLIPAISGR